MGSLEVLRFARVVDLTDHEIKLVPFARIGIRREMSRRDALPHFQREDVEAREYGRKDHERRCEKGDVVEALEAEKSAGSAECDHAQEYLVCGERLRVIKEGSRAHRQESRDEAARVESTLDHAFGLGSVDCGLSSPLRRWSRHLR